MRKRYKFSSIAIGVAAMSAPVYAGQIGDTISFIENNVTINQNVGTPVDLNNSAPPSPAAVVNAVLSSPVGIMDGYTYTNNSFLVADGTGSLDVFGKFSTVANDGTPGDPGSFPTGYTPTSGDILTVTGEYSPFDGIPEIENVNNATYGSLFSYTAAGLGSGTGGVTVNETSDLNANNLQNPAWLGAPANEYTAAQTANNTPTANTFAVLGQYVELDNVQIISGTSTPFAAGAKFPTHANATYSIVGPTGGMELFFWASSYSTDGALGGTVIPQGLIDAYGFISLDVFGGVTVPQFTPTSFVAVPEPASLSLLALGGISLLARRRQRKA